MKPLIVGEAPGRKGRRAPVAGRCGLTLARYAGLSPRAFYRTFARTNVLPTWPGAAAKKGARFPAKGARINARAIAQREFWSGRTIILLGKRVARAFLCRPEYFVGQATGGAMLYVVPHPSGVNAWYNAAENRDRTSRFMRTVALLAREP